MFDLVQRLLAARKPSSNHSLFLVECLAFFQIKVINDGRTHELSRPKQFVKTFAEASTSDQHLLCELYLHNYAIPENRKLNLNSLIGNVQLREFVSFLANQITWQTTFLSARHNEGNHLLWIRYEPQNLVIFVVEYHQFLKELGMGEHIKQLQPATLQDCQHFVKTMGVVALKANNLLWQRSYKERQEYHPFSPPNAEATISREPKYIRCLQ